MTRPTLTALIVLVALPGCSTRNVSAPQLPRTDPAATIQGIEAKDAGIKTEAEGIRARNTEPDFVALSAERILDIIRLSPAETHAAAIRAITAERDAQAKRADAAEAKLTSAAQKLAEADAKTTRTIRLSLAGLGALFAILAGVGAVLVAKVSAVFPLLGRDIIIGLGALSGVFFTASFAYGWAAKNEGKVMIVIGVILAGILALVWSNFRHEKLADPRKKPTLTAS
jgi:hypothetical protein